MATKQHSLAPAPPPPRGSEQFRLVSPEQAEEETRNFSLNAANKFPDNHVSHQQYNVVNLIPKFLFNQFRHFFNFFYLVITLTQFVPAFRIGFLITYISPLLFVLMISFVKEMWDEFQRWKRDYELNHQKYTLLSPVGRVQIPSQDIKVGNVLEIQAGVRIPADLILLRTSDPIGTSFIKTTQLDGETDWKLRRAISVTQNDPSINLSTLTFEVEKPSSSIYEFSGRFHYDSQRHAIGVESTVWCDTVVASGTIVGAVAYTGTETRSAMNGTPVPVKTGTVDKEINKYSSVLFLLLFLASFLATALNGFHSNFHVLFIRFVLLFSFIIPISMRVNLDLSKIVFSLKISHDPQIDGAIMRNSNIPEELGRIQILFSDKTGTLTRNDMEFRKLHIDHDVLSSTSPRSLIEEHGISVLCLSLCHCVTVTKDGFQASSPDEIALVKYAADCGYVLLDRTDERIVVRLPNGKEELFSIVALLPFSSVWRHMSIVVRSETYGILAITKGADVSVSQMVPPSEWLEEVVGNLAREGLRTLVYSYRKLTEEELTDFLTVYHEATVSVVDRSKCILNSFSRINKGMELMGVTGVEDRLQDNVPETLEALEAAKINVWMLTGDKLETATCVALSSRLFTRGAEFSTIRTLSELITCLDRAQSRVPYLVIDGSVMQQALTSFPEVFISFAIKAPAVAICRCSPSQKELIVKAMMQYRKVVSCAVGDGGNDVSMIQAASIGIGIVGREGKQASLAADCSINSFSHLLRLVLWHGTNSYKHTSRLSQFVMHRGVIMTTTQAIYSLLFNLVPSPLYNDWLMMGFATVFTCAPVFSLIFDDFVVSSTVMAFPELYTKCQRGRYLSGKTFIWWTWLAIFQGCAIMFLSSLAFGMEGEDERMLQSVAYTSMILTELALVAMEINKFNIVSVGAEVVSVMIFIASLFLLPQAFDVHFVFSLEFTWKVALISAVCILPLGIYEIIKKFCTPTHEERLRSSNPSAEDEAFFIL